MTIDSEGNERTKVQCPNCNTFTVFLDVIVYKPENIVLCCICDLCDEYYEILLTNPKAQQ